MHFRLDTSMGITPYFTPARRRESSEFRNEIRPAISEPSNRGHGICFAFIRSSIAGP